MCRSLAPSFFYEVKSKGEEGVRLIADEVLEIGVSARGFSYS